MADAARARALAGVPAATRQLLEAEDDLRRLLDTAEPRFEDLDQAAVLAGQAPPPPPADRIPEGRWSYHPSGYFIRYLPITRYTRTRIQVYFPEDFQVRRDASGRLTIVTPPAPAPRPGLWQAAGFTPRVGASLQGTGSLAPFQPGGGSGVGPGQRQRGGGSARSAPPANNNVVNKAQQVTGALNNLSTPLGVLSGDMGLPGWMTGKLLDWNFSNAQEINTALGGSDADAGPAEGSAASGMRFIRTGGARSGARRPQTQDPAYMTLSRPVPVEVSPVDPSPHVPRVHAAEGRKVREAALRLTATLHALSLARRRFVAASEAGRTDWVVRQGSAVVHLKHLAGGQMLLLADALEGLRPHLTPGSVAALVRAAQAEPEAQALSAEAVAAARALGVGEAELARFRSQVRALDPARVAADAPEGARRLADALRAYGEYWQTLPRVAAPWG